MDTTATEYEMLLTDEKCLIEEIEQEKKHLAKLEMYLEQIRQNLKREKDYMADQLISRTCNGNVAL